MHAPAAICLWNKKPAQQRTPALSAVIYELLSLEEWLVQPVLTQHPKGSLTGCSGLSWGNMWLYSHCADQESQECSASHSLLTPCPLHLQNFPLSLEKTASPPCPSHIAFLSLVSRAGLTCLGSPSVQLWGPSEHPVIIHFPFGAFAPNISLTLKAVCP